MRRTQATTGSVDEGETWTRHKEGTIGLSYVGTQITARTAATNDHGLLG